MIKALLVAGVLSGGPYEFTLLSVIDGDTFRADIHLGLGVTLNNQRVRLARVDAPELRSTACEIILAHAAAHRLAALLPGATITITGEDAFGRWLAEINTGSRNVNDTLVQEGHARYWPIREKWCD